MAKWIKKWRSKASKAGVQAVKKRDYTLMNMDASLLMKF